MKERIESETKERMRIRRLMKRQCTRELRVEPGFQTHEHLLQIVKPLPTDVEPGGKRRSAPLATAHAGVAGFTFLQAGWAQTGVYAPIPQVRVRAY
jgi:hypothetical protein